MRKNDNYGCALTLNSSKQFWNRGTSKRRASAGGSKRVFAPLCKLGLRAKIFEKTWRQQLNSDYR